MEPNRLTATEGLRAIAAGRLTAADWMEACLAQALAREPVLRAFAHLDPGQARRNAAAARPGPLHGVPFAVKDVLDTADMPTAHGSPIWAGNRPRGDAACVAAVRAAGGAILGKTITTEFATRSPGPTTHPLDPARTPGGSSSGSAAAVGAGIVPLAFGTQTLGSIIRPAAYCGAVGFKPSFGTIHRGGMKVVSESLDTIGVIARSVADCALAVGTIAGAHLGDPEARRDRAPRLLLTLGHAPQAATAPVVESLHAVAAAARRAGAEVVEVPLPGALARGAAVHSDITYQECRQALAWEWMTAPAMLSADMRARLAAAEAAPAGTLERARLAAEATREAFAAWTEGFDAVLTPSQPAEAPLGHASTGDPVMNFLWTQCWGPCVTVPAGTGPAGMPIGAQVVGRIGTDAATLGWARWLQAAIG